MPALEQNTAADEKELQDTFKRFASKFICHDGMAENVPAWRIGISVITEINA